MANSASERALRSWRSGAHSHREARAVDVMVAVGPNMFYPYPRYGAHMGSCDQGESDAFRLVQSHPNPLPEVEGAFRFPDW